jgi:hypothetical protein
MSDLESRSGAAFDRIIGNVVNSAVTTWMAVHTGSADSAATVGGVVGPLAEELSFKLRKIVDVQDNRTQDMLDEAATAASSSTEDLIDAALNDPGKLELLLRAVDAARHATTDKKIRLLGQLFAAGVLAEDGAVVDDHLIAIDAIGQLDAPHLRLMAILIDPSPVWWDDVASRSARRYSWPEDRIIERDGGLRLAIRAIIAKLVSLGIVQDDGNGLWSLTSFGDLCIRAFHEQARGSKAGQA